MADNGNGKAKQILAWAREHGNAFRGGEAAEFLGIEPTGVGPTLRAMVGRGELTKGKNEDDKTVYTAVPVETPDIGDIGPSIVPALKQEVADRLAEVNSEIASLDAKRSELDGEAGRLRNTYTVLNAD